MVDVGTDRRGMADQISHERPYVSLEQNLGRELRCYFPGHGPARVRNPDPASEFRTDERKVKE
jgi:hypothetical protein